MDDQPITASSTSASGTVSDNLLTKTAYDDTNTKLSTMFKSVAVAQTNTPTMNTHDNAVEKEKEKEDDQEEEEEEDISDEAVLNRHDTVLKNMRDKWMQLQQLRQQRKEMLQMTGSSQSGGPSPRARSNSTSNSQFNNQNSQYKRNSSTSSKLSTEDSLNTTAGGNTGMRTSMDVEGMVDSSSSSFANARSPRGRGGHYGARRGRGRGKRRGRGRATTTPSGHYEALSMTGEEAVIGASDGIETETTQIPLQTTTASAAASTNVALGTRESTNTLGSLLSDSSAPSDTGNNNNNNSNDDDDEEEDDDEDDGEEDEDEENDDDDVQQEPPAKLRRRNSKS